MLAEYMNETESNIRKMNIIDQTKLYLKINEWFEVHGDLDEISPTKLNNYLWSFDPIIATGGIVDFCLQNGLIQERK